MSKQVITRLFVGGVVALIAGIVLATAAVFWAFASGGFVLSGQEVVGINGSAFSWTIIGIIVAAGLVIVGGAIAGLVAWIGALLNTVQLEDKMWFVLLLVTGLLSFGWIAMIAYVIGGPDGTRPGVVRSTPPTTIAAPPLGA